MGSSTATGYSYQQQQRRQRHQDNDIDRVSDIQMKMKIKRFDSPSTENYINPNAAKAPNIKHNSPEVKDVCYFAERIRHMLDVKINHMRTAMEKSDDLFKSDMIMIRIQALQWETHIIPKIIERKYNRCHWLKNAVL